MRAAARPGSRLSAPNPHTGGPWLAGPTAPPAPRGRFGRCADRPRTDSPARWGCPNPEQGRIAGLDRPGDVGRRQQQDRQVLMQRGIVRINGKTFPQYRDGINGAPGGRKRRRHRPRTWPVALPARIEVVTPLTGTVTPERRFIHRFRGSSPENQRCRSTRSGRLAGPRAWPRSFPALRPPPSPPAAARAG